MVLGLLLVLLSGGAVALLAADNRSGGPDYTVSFLNNDIATLNGLQIFFAGIALALLFCLGLWMMGAAARRRRALRAEIRAARNDAQAAAAERDRLAGQMDDRTAATGPVVTTPAHARVDGEAPARRRFLGRRHDEPAYDDERAPTRTP